MNSQSSGFSLHIRYNRKFMERLNKRENELIERRNDDNFESIHRPRLENPFIDSDDEEEEKQNKREVEELLKYIPTSKIVKNNDIECMICLSKLKIGDKESTLPCLHIFHFHCIKKWIYQKRWCPICKYNIDI